MNFLISISKNILNVIIGVDEDGPKIRLGGNFTKRLSAEHFPEGEPADYEAEMAERIHKIVADTPGDFQKVMMPLLRWGSAREQDFQFWALANFKGEFGQQMKWMTEQILVGGELENIQYTVPEDMSTLLPTLTEVDPQDTWECQHQNLQATTSATASIESPPTRSNENSVRLQQRTFKRNYRHQCR